MSKTISKRVLAVFLSITLMLTTFVTSNIGSLIGSAQVSAITVTDNVKEDVYFYTPEQIYLTPDIDAHLTQDRYTFQWFVDSDIDRTTHLATPRTGENSKGNFYFYYKNATSVTVSFKYLNQDHSVMDAYTSTSQSSTIANYANQNSTIKLAQSTVALSASNTRSDVARTRFTVSSNTLDTTVTREGFSPYLLADTTGYYIEWTVNFVDGADGITKSVKSYTYVYKPFIQPAGVAQRTENNRGTNSFAQNISWVSGVHGFSTTGSYYPKSEVGSRGLVAFSSSNPSGVQLGKVGTKYYAQFANSVVENGRFGYASDNNRADEWISTGATELFKTPSFNYIDNNTDGSNTGDNAFYTFQTAPTSRIMIDVSRYSNFSQIPNLSVGMMVTDDEATEGSGAWYVADMTGRSDSLSSDKGYQKNSTSTGESYWNNYNSVFAGEGTYASPVGNAEVNEVKYNGPWIKTVSGSSTSGYYNIRTAYFNHDGSGDHYGGDTNWNVSVIPVYVTVNNKQKLREAYENAVSNVAYFGLREDGTTPYYNSSSSYWTKFVSLYQAAGKLLANLDTMTYITVDSTSYTCDQLATELNSAVTNVQASRYSSVANAMFFALELDANGNYILRTIKDNTNVDDVSIEARSYKYGNNVSYVAPDFPGYTYVGYLNGIDYSAGNSIGSDYSAKLTGTETSLSSKYIDYQNVSYTFLYVPKEISSIVDTEDGVFNFMKTLDSDFPAGAGYPSATAREGVVTDFNYRVEGNDVIAWSSTANKSEQYMFLPFYAELLADTSYRVTYDVTGTSPENVQFTIVNDSFTGGNGISTSVYTVNASGETFTTNSVDKGRAYIKLELMGDARSGKSIRISNICIAFADKNELYIDTTQGYPAVYSPSTSAPKTNMGYTTTGISKVAVTTRYNTLMYDQYQLLPYYIQLKPNCSYSIEYELSGLDASKVVFSLYNDSFIGGNGKTMNYYEFDSVGGVITTGPTDDAVAQLMVQIVDSGAGTKATFENLKIENLDSKTAITGTYNKTTTLGIPVKEGYALDGWTLKSNSGGTAHGTVMSTSNDRVYDYTFGSDIDIIEAEWIPATLNVIFRGEDGTVISEQNIIYGNSATAPSASDVPEKFGHTFVGWDTEFATVTKNLIIEPIYEQKDITVIVNSDASEIFEGSTTNVSAMFEPNEDGISAVEWTSNNNSVATVNENGVVTGISAGTATITGTIIYDGRTYSASTNIKVNPVEVTGISINTAPDKTTYFVGETFDPTGLSLLVTYNNGETAVIDSDYTLNTVNTSYAGAKTVRVTYKGYTTTTRITVVDIVMTSIEITKLPYVTTYFVGDAEFESAGIVVVAHYNNGDVAELDLGDLDFIGFDTSSVGNVTITVCYEDFEDTFEINVAEPSIIGITIKNHPAKKSYFVGDEADYTGLKLIATYSNGTTAEISDGYSISGFDSETAVI